MRFPMSLSRFVLTIFFVQGVSFLPAVSQSPVSKEEVIKKIQELKRDWRFLFAQTFISLLEIGFILYVSYGTLTRSYINVKQKRNIKGHILF